MFKATVETSNSSASVTKRFNHPQMRITVSCQLV